MNVIKELIGNNIPEDEAKVLSNGRITCLICIHRPIFDTLGVLVSHRRGKRHASELQKYLKRKDELEFIQLKKKQQLTPAQSANVIGLGKSNKKFDRKRKLELPLMPKKIQVHSSTTSKLLNVYLDVIQKKPQFKDSLMKTKEQYSPSLNEGCSSSTNVVKKSSLKQSSVKGERLSIDDSNVMYERELKMAGWLKDSSGRWIKDPDAEFDSDEGDCPPPPPTIY